MVAGLDFGHLRPDRFHDTGSFVSEHRGQGKRDTAGLDRQIGVTYSTRCDPHLNVVGSNGRQLDIGDLKLSSDLWEHGGPHRRHARWATNRAATTGQPGRHDRVVEVSTIVIAASVVPR
jgi:hypothetical protein